jgi:hypothetical protein
MERPSMPLRSTRLDQEGPPERPTRPLESRVARLEAIAALLVRHIRETDVMSDEELERIERDLEG